MRAWKRVPPVPMDAAQLPEGWEIIHDAAHDHYAVIGRAGSQHPDTEHIDVVLRVDFARAPDGADIRPLLATAIVRGVSTLVIRHRAQMRAELERQENNGTNDAENQRRGGEPDV